MNINFEKNKGLVPVIVQDSATKNVLMLAYMNKEALEITIQTKRVTFYSRSKKRLWVKGEESGNFLELKSLNVDCDQDTLLITAIPNGPVCHKGTDNCWGQDNRSDFGFLSKLEVVIEQRKKSPAEQSYTASLFEGGINKIAQKVGEEAVELVIESKDNNGILFINEAADLLFHYLILLNAKGFELNDVVDCLRKRHEIKRG